MKTTPGMKANIWLSVFFPSSDRKENSGDPRCYFKMRKQFKLLWIRRSEILWEIFSNFYFHLAKHLHNF